MTNRPTFRTKLCDILEIEYPIMLAGMGDDGATGPAQRGYFRIKVPPIASEHPVYASPCPNIVLTGRCSRL